MLYPRAKAILIVIPLALDCAANAAFLRNGSFDHTLSAVAWKNRDQPYWFWCYKFIDFLFYTGHCEDAFLTEEKFGSIWVSWLNDLQGGV